MCASLLLSLKNQFSEHINLISSDLCKLTTWNISRNYTKRNKVEVTKVKIKKAGQSSKCTTEKDDSQFTKNTFLSLAMHK